MIINGLTIFDENSTWGDIIEFREKMENKLYLYRMRKKLLEISEAGDRVNLLMEIAWERDEFGKKLRSLRRKNRMIMAKSILSFAADVIPNIVKLNWGKMTEAGIDIVDRSYSGIDGMMELGSGLIDAARR